MGAPAGRAGRIEGFAEDDVTRLLGDETFRGIVEAYRGLYELPHGEALLRLLKISMGVIQEAVMEGRNAHVAAWVMWMAERGLDPAMSLAQQVVRAVERSGTARLLGSGQAPPRAARPLQTLGQRVRRGLDRTATRLRDAVLGEIAVEAAAARAESVVRTSAPGTAATVRQPRQPSPVPSFRRASPAAKAPPQVKPRSIAQAARASP